jgi:hypothetical protein
MKNSWGQCWGERGFIRVKNNIEEELSGIYGIMKEESYIAKKVFNPTNPMFLPYLL